jgi:hypothetical protein
MAAQRRISQGGGAAHRLHLHARALEIPHPAGFTLKVTAPLPPHMQRMWEFFGFDADIPDPFADAEALRMKRVYKSVETRPAEAAGASRSTVASCAPRRSAN